MNILNAFLEKVAGGYLDGHNSRHAGNKSQCLDFAQGSGHEIQELFKSCSTKWTIVSMMVNEGVYSRPWVR